MNILPLSSPLATLESCGGKGANLARLIGHGFPVPDGFVLVTDAYRAFLEDNALHPLIDAALADVSPDDPAKLEIASERIRAAFSAGRVPLQIVQQLEAAYRAMDYPPVAVRSSATAEDLPGLSFAGQQDTFLNVSGQVELLKAVIDCWSSLWTARAIGYRLRNAIDQSEVTLAVVVQRMVPSAASGVLFTANPLTGLRSETVIDATLGLGDALVSGQVEPDHYVVDSSRGIIREKHLGSKTIVGNTAIDHRTRASQALTDEQILSLTHLGQQVADRFGEPQDIEWALADGCLNLVQSRPITTLFPIPAGLAAGRLHVLFSFGAVQGILDPFTPFGQNIIQTAFASFGRWLGFQFTYRTQRVVRVAAERLWINFTPVLTHSVGRRIARGALRFVEPSAGQAVEQIWDDPRLLPDRAGFRPRTILRLAKFFFPVIVNAIGTLLTPDARRAAIHAHGERVLATFAASIRSTGSSRDKLRRIMGLIENDLPRIIQTMPIYISMIVSGMATLNIINQLAAHLDRSTQAEDSFTRRALEMTRGLPYNPTTEMDLELWETSRRILDDDLSRRLFTEQPVEELVSAYQAGTLPATAQAALEPFMQRFGMRAVGEIDLGRPRWREDPTSLFQTIASYLEITDPQVSPPVVFERGAQAAEAAVESLAVALRETPGGWFKARLARWAAGRMRRLLGQRESPKFFIIRVMAVLRNAMLDAGRDLVDEGVLAAPEDVFFLDLAEIDALADGQAADWRALVKQRRETYARESLRRQIPRLLLSDGRAFYAGLASTSTQDGTLTGSPVSPGSAEGIVHVVFDPRGARLAPGEILVCPGTDPAWTPLFLAAGGLIMEVGGMMTHGAVVAREYGIPAVVGVHEATTRLRNGQRVRVDGSSGVIQVIDE